MRGGHPLERLEMRPGPLGSAMNNRPPGRETPDARRHHVREPIGVAADGRASAPGRMSNACGHALMS